jgi:hypothetical protein
MSSKFFKTHWQDSRWIHQAISKSFVFLSPFGILMHPA